MHKRQETFTITITVTEADMRAAADEFLEDGTLDAESMYKFSEAWHALEDELSLCTYMEFVSSGSRNPEDPAEYLRFLAENWII
tara:strand:- start:278 stop:529 length:252 start_codon:yes stop_codon:yes gene_type:complete